MVNVHIAVVPIQMHCKKYLKMIISILDFEQNFYGLTHTKEDVSVLKLAIQRHGVHVLLPSGGHRQHLQNDMLENHRI